MQQNRQHHANHSCCYITWGDEGHKYLEKGPGKQRQGERLWWQRTWAMKTGGQQALDSSLRKINVLQAPGGMRASGEFLIVG